MLRLAPAPALVLALLGSALTTPVRATDPERDFSGKWFLDARNSNTRALPMPPEQTLTVVQQDVAVRCSSTGADGAVVQWSYLLDGTETRSRIGDETRSSIAKWEGAALLINTQVLASQDYTVMDRWQLSANRAVLTVTRQVVRQIGEVEGVMVYVRDPQPAVAEATTLGQPEQPVLVRPQPERPAAGELTVPLGTRIALSLRNGLDTKHSHQGDRVYLETIAPIAVDGRVVIRTGHFRR